ncbi:hypothetical protein D3C84_1061070 [compost metagenome]
MALGQQGKGIGPQQGGTLALAEERRIFPGPQRQQATDTFPGLQRITAVHVQAQRTAVELRGADLDQLAQRELQLDLGQDLLQAEHGLEHVGSGLVIVVALAVHHGGFSDSGPTMRRAW